MPRLSWARVLVLSLCAAVEKHDVPSALSRFRSAGGACIPAISHIPATAERRHIVSPPEGPVALVCCATTKGPLSIAVHPRWAPRGAQRFMDMVRQGHFDEGVPMMRCLKEFLCQFGLSANPSRNGHSWPSLKDDPPWLPHGPKYRSDASGGQRFKTGYMAYAGAGSNSRAQQLIVANHDDCCLAGGSPWEVPFGELVGEDSFQTLAQIYTGYGENGPSQGHLTNAGWTQADAEKFPLLDHITSCAVLEDATDVSDWEPYADGFMHPTFRGAASMPQYAIPGAPP